MSTTEIRKHINLLENVVVGKRKSIGKDLNGLEFSDKSGSGYKFVTTFLNGPLKGKFIAFADVKSEKLQDMNQRYGNHIPGFFGHKNIVGLGVFDDVRDAAYVGQQFYGGSEEQRDSNLEGLFAGNPNVIPKSPRKWQYEPDWAQVNAAIEKMADASEKRKETIAKNKPTLTPQTAMAKFFKEHGSEYNVTSKDGGTIRSQIESLLKDNKRPTDDDYMAAAERAFEPYMK